jgi:hypothetical protein
VEEEDEEKVRGEDKLGEGDRERKEWKGVSEKDKMTRRRKGEEAREWGIFTW